MLEFISIKSAPVNGATNRAIAIGNGGFGSKPDAPKGEKMEDDVSFAKRIIQEVRPSGTWYWPVTGLIYTLHHDVKVAVLENTPGPENYHYHERVSAAWNGAGWKVLPEMHEMKRSGGILVN